jgi:hypothetical protein
MFSNLQRTKYDKNVCQNLNKIDVDSVTMTNNMNNGQKLFSGSLDSLMNKEFASNMKLRSNGQMVGKRRLTIP